MRLFTFVTALRNNRDRNEIRKQTNPWLRKRYYHRMRIGSCNALDVTLPLVAGAFEEAGGLCKAIIQDGIESIFRISRGECAAVLELHSIANDKSKSQSIIRTFNVRSQL